MKKNKIILSHCPYFYKINEFVFFEDDRISGKLIQVYRNYVFSIDVNDDKQLHDVEKIDYILNKYIDDYMFRKQIQKELLNSKIKSDGSIVNSIVDILISLYDIYESGYTRNIYFARWI